jgi:hypothetical protein
LTNHDGEEDFIAILLGFDEKKKMFAKRENKKKSIRMKLPTVFWGFELFEVRNDFENDFNGNFEGINRRNLSFY